MHDNFLQRLFPWLLLAAVTLSSLAFVMTYGADLPRADEWRDALVLLEGRSLTLEWLWAPHNVHRAPLSRLVRYLLYAVSGDFRSALVFSVLIMGGAAAALLAAARRIRGRSSWTDLFIPLVVVGPAHFMNFLWGFQVAFTLSASLFLTTLALVASCQGSPSPRRLAAIAALSLCQVMTGANGLALALPMMAWVLWVSWRSKEGSAATRAPALVMTGVAAFVVLAYPVGLGMQPSGAPFRNAVPATLQFLSTGLSPAAPWWKGRALLVVTLAAVASWLLAGAWKGRPGERFRSAGLGAGMAASLMLAAVVGLGRRDLGAQAGLFPRYATLAAPLACLLFLIFTLYGSSRPARSVPAILAVLALPLTAINTAMALGYGGPRQAQVRLLHEDARRGLPPEAIAARNGTAIYQYTQGVQGYLDRLVERRAWPFEEFEFDPEIRTGVISRVEVPPASRILQQMSPDGAAYRATGPAPQLEIDLGGARPVAAAEITFILNAPADRMVRLEVHWGAGTESGYPWWTRRAAFPVRPDGKEQALTVWIYDTIDRLRLDPGRAPGSFQLTGLTLLELAPDWLPADRTPAAAGEAR